VPPPAAACTSPWRRPVTASTSSRSSWGPSGKGRKGSACDHVEALLSKLDRQFAERCISSGLSSGEGLIFEVRDPSEGDGGACDKRRLIVEPEFAQVLKVLAREGNTSLGWFASASSGPLYAMCHRCHLCRLAAHSPSPPPSPTAPGGSRVDMSATCNPSDPRVLTHRPLDNARHRRQVYGPLSRGEEAGRRRHPPRRGARRPPRRHLRHAGLQRADRPCRTWRRRSRSGATASTPRGGSSATRSAIRQQTRSGRSPRTPPQGVTRSEVLDLFSRNKKAREIDRALTVLEEGRAAQAHQPSRRRRTARRALAATRRLKDARPRLWQRGRSRRVARHVA